MAILLIISLYEKWAKKLLLKISDFIIIVIKIQFQFPVDTNLIANKNLKIKINIVISCYKRFLKRYLTF